MGHDVYIASNDRNWEWHGKPLAQLPGVLDVLPTHFNEATDKVVKLSDVLWLDDNAVAAAFEVEKSTVIYSGLLRVRDLLVTQLNLDIPIFPVAPDVHSATPPTPRLVAVTDVVQGGCPDDVSRGPTMTTCSAPQRDGSVCVKPLATMRP